MNDSSGNLKTLTPPSEEETLDSGLKSTQKNPEQEWKLQEEKLGTAWNIQKLDNQNRRTLKLADRVSEILLGNGDGESENEETSQMIRIDSPDIHHHYSAETPNTESKGISTLLKAAVVAGLIGSGAGAWVGIPLAIDALTSPPPVIRPAEIIIQPSEIHDWKLGEPVVE